ncbi:hypothetical protein [Marinomonas sp.]|uniref:hypothetical protein n=1 Tax=Marinomonas sp. TaxID=1904862 RepID=UPI003A94A2B9
MRNSINPRHETLRANIARDVEAFLAKQSVTVIPSGESGQDALTGKRRSEFTINGRASTGVKKKPTNPKKVKNNG